MNATVKRFVMVPVVFVLLGLFTINEGYAQSLDDLRVGGQVGEAFDGYARARDGSFSDMVKGINAKRKAIYEERAAEQGVSTDQVARVYAKQIFSKAPNGTWFLKPDGSWVQK